jgi:hypothetical protein
MGRLAGARWRSWRGRLHRRSGAKVGTRKAEGAEFEGGFAAGGEVEGELTAGGVERSCWWPRELRRRLRRGSARGRSRRGGGLWRRSRGRGVVLVEAAGGRVAEEDAAAAVGLEAVLLRVNDDGADGGMAA